MIRTYYRTDDGSEFRSKCDANEWSYVLLKTLHKDLYMSDSSFKIVRTGDLGYGLHDSENKEFVTYSKVSSYDKEI